MLVSVHLPKTAGTSFRHLLESHYGDSLRQDYEDRPLHSLRWARRAQAACSGVSHLLSAESLKAVECVHGHFLPLKYRFARTRSPLRFVTWLRDPVERLASHYHYWLRSYDPAEAGTLHRRVVEEGWSLERFCFSPELRNLYSEFLWCFPLGHFTFVGITEHYAEDARQFAALLPGDVKPANHSLNVNASRAEKSALDASPAATVNSAAAGRDDRYISDTDLRASIESFHAADAELYRRALSMREARSRHD